ncbi:hypothetical protein Pla144_45460 [Bythopirellula polymerisocia]|uniref:Uncharacterized protein n=1 Tax=Bythopirellula polymerisocia TaxID=2528003 RepID=A0A5C6CB54_9BACT|nr:hypothetical protein Pla144_45460 [Bythopirellula polymerisocia]
MGINSERKDAGTQELGLNVTIFARPTGLAREKNGAHLNGTNLRT